MGTGGSGIDRIRRRVPFHVARLIGHSAESGLNLGLRFSRCDANPSCTSAPEKPRNSKASDVSNTGPAIRSQLFSEYFVQRMALCAPSASREAISTAFESNS